MAIQIFDLDGTLTYGFGDIVNTTAYSNYSYWHILSTHSVNNPDRLKKQIQEWRENIKKHSDLASLSQKFMQAVVDDFPESVDRQALSQKAEEVTLDFIEHGVIRLPMIEKLQASLEKQDRTVITSGSYLEAVQGFVNILVKKELLDAELASRLHLVGATIDWSNRKLQHSNVHQHKVIGLEKILELPAEEISKELIAVYGDDPWVNDAGIFGLLKHGQGYVVETKHNQYKRLSKGLKRLKTNG